MAQPVAQCVAIVNPQGGGGRARKAWKKAAPVVRRYLRPDFELVERFTSQPGDASQLAAEAMAAGADVVLAVGGDGTISEVVNGLMDPHEQQQQQKQQQQKQQQQQQKRQPSPLPGGTTALAILPLGTGSDFARTFGWAANDVPAACSRIKSGRRQLLDIGRAVLRQCSCRQESGRQAVACTCRGGFQVRFFANIASCGAGARSAERVGKFKLLGRLAYPVAAVLALRRFSPSDLMVRCGEGGSWRSFTDTTILCVGNGQAWGGGMRVLPHADPADGVFDALAMQHMGLRDFVLRGHLLRSGRHEGVAGVTSLPRCSQISVQAVAGSAVPAWELDGEPVGECGEVTLELVPGALRLCV